jgi:AraC-type DNA-binding domain-containing proteins
MNVKEVCFKVGYNDPNYFSKVFKKYEGISPINYKGTNEGEII